MTDMPIRTIVLNSRRGAKRRWPGSGALATWLSADGAVTEHCCIGCEGLARGIPIPAMVDEDYPCEEISAEWVKIWDREVPRDVMERVTGIVGENPEEAYGELYQSVAAFLNDEIAPHDPDSAVAGIRVLFRALGESQGERWIVRWLR